MGAFGSGFGIYNSSGGGGASAITGSGTPNFQSRFITSNTIGDGVIQDDGSTTAIGTSPVVNQTLTIKGNDRISNHSLILTDLVDSTIFGFRNDGVFELSALGKVAYSNGLGGNLISDVTTAIRAWNFPDASGEILLDNLLAAANGIATLDVGGKVPNSQLPFNLMEFLGNWDATTNTPTLSNTDVGAQGNTYKVSVAGTQDFGAGNITFDVGDWVVNNGTIWEKVDNTDAVTSVNGNTGIVTTPLAAVLAQGTTTGANSISVNAGQNIIYNSGAFNTIFGTGALTANRIITLPDNSGTVALVSDIPAPIAITDDILPRGTGATIEDGTWGNVGNDIYPVTTGSNIGDATHRIGTIFMSSVLDYSTNGLIISSTAIGVNYVEIQTSSGDNAKRFVVAPVGYTVSKGTDFAYKATDSVGAIIEGFNSSAGNYGLRIYNSGQSIMSAAFHNNGDVELASMGGTTTMGTDTNYLKQTFNYTKQFTNTSTSTDLIASNDTNSLNVNIGLSANKFGKSIIKSTHFLAFEMQWNGTEGAGGIERMRLNDAGNLSIGFQNSGTARLHVRGVGSTSSTIGLLFEDVAGNDRYVLADNGQTASAVGFNAAINANVGHYNLVGGKATGYLFSASGATSSAVQVTQVGDTPTGLFVQGQSSSTGVVRTASFDNKSTSGTQHVGVYSFARNGSQYNIGTDGLVGGGDATAPSVYGAGIRGVAAHQLDVLQYGGIFTAKYANSVLTYTEDSVGIVVSAEAINGAADSTGQVVGVRCFTAGVRGTGDRIALHVPATGNNGSVLIGADNKSSAAALVELASTTQAFLLMRMTGDQAILITPSDGMLLYVTATEVTTFSAIGFWGYENGFWIQL